MYARLPSWLATTSCGSSPAGTRATILRVAGSTRASALSSFSRTSSAGDGVWEIANGARNVIAQSCIAAIQNLFEVICLLAVLPAEHGEWSIYQTLPWQAERKPMFRAEGPRKVKRSAKPVD